MHRFTWHPDRYTKGIPNPGVPINSHTHTVAYIRVSTDKQADHGVSLDAQRTKVEAYAALYDLELVEVILDAEMSAKTLDRPGLHRALAALGQRMPKPCWWSSWTGSRARSATSARWSRTTSPAASTHCFC